MVDLERIIECLGLKIKENIKILFCIGSSNYRKTWGFSLLFTVIAQIKGNKRTLSNNLILNYKLVFSLGSADIDKLIPKIKILKFYCHFYSNLSYTLHLFHIARIPLQRLHLF